MIPLASGVYRLKNGDLLVRGLEDWLHYRESAQSRWRLVARLSLSLTVRGIETELEKSKPKERK